MRGTARDARPGALGESGAVGQRRARGAAMTAGGAAGGGGSRTAAVGGRARQPGPAHAPCPPAPLAPRAPAAKLISRILDCNKIYDRSGNIVRASEIPDPGSDRTNFRIGCSRWQPYLHLSNL